MIVTAGESGLVAQTKIAYGDFLTRQGGAQLEVLRYFNSAIKLKMRIISWV